MEFNFEGHIKLWLLLSKNIHLAARKNYSGNGCYNAYGALEMLKKELLQKHFPEEERNPRNCCFACEAAHLFMEENWIIEDDYLCDYCPMQWPGERRCDEKHSLYCQLVCCLENNDIDSAAELCVKIAYVKPYNGTDYEKPNYRKSKVPAKVFC